MWLVDLSCMVSWAVVRTFLLSLWWINLPFIFVIIYIIWWTFNLSHVLYWLQEIRVFSTHIMLVLPMPICLSRIYLMKQGKVDRCLKWNDSLLCTMQMLVSTCWPIRWALNFRKASNFSIIVTVMFQAVPLHHIGYNGHKRVFLSTLHIAWLMDFDLYSQFPKEHLFELTHVYFLTCHAIFKFHLPLQQSILGIT